MTRIGVAGPLGPDLFASNVADCLADLDIEVVELGQPTPQLKTHRRRVALELAMKASARLSVMFDERWAQTVADQEVDAVISVVALSPETVLQLRLADIEVALWFPDHLGNLGRNLMFAAPYTRLYFKDRLVAQRVSDIQGAPAAYMPEACNPRWHRPQGGVPGNDGDVVVAGNIYPTRAALLQRMLNDEIPLRLYGGLLPAWLPNARQLAPLHAGREIYCEEKARTFRRAPAVLNNLHPSELTSMNCRLFEAAGSGAAVLTEHRDSLDELFDVETEVLAFRTYDELVKQWRRLQDDPDLGRRVGDAAAVRAQTEHTYQHRLQLILQDLL